MKVVITGAAGFIGRQLAERLAAQGVLPGHDGTPTTIRDLVLFDTVRPASLAAAGSRVRVVQGDIGDMVSVGRAITPGTDVVFHLAAVVSAAAEADFDLGVRVNIEGTVAVLEACRALGSVPRLVFASSIAVFGGDAPATITDTTAPMPQTSYGAQKAIGELLVGDYSRKGFIDGRSLRLPTIVVRPGKPNKAASTFASSIIREPLAGADAVCPVEPETRMVFLSPRRAVAALIHAVGTPAAAWGGSRSVTLPGIEAGIAEVVEALGRVAGPGPVGRIRWVPDERIRAIVAGWPFRFAPEKALALGFTPDGSLDEIIKAHIDDQLGGRFEA